MPFEQKYTPETRDASLARVLERREAEPGNRSIIRETADEFQVGEQSLRSWIRAYEKTSEPEADAEAEPVGESAAVPAESGRARRPGRRSAAPAPAASAPAAQAPTASAPATSTVRESRIAELEAEVKKLRRDREALKSALAVLLDD